MPELYARGVQSHGYPVYPFEPTEMSYTVYGEDLKENVGMLGSEADVLFASLTSW